MTIKVNHLTGTTYYPADDQNQWAATEPNGSKSGFAVLAHSPNNLSVDVSAGTGFYNGLFMNSDAVQNVAIGSNVSGYGRIDSIVADMDNGIITAVQGTPSATPTAPVLTGNKLLLSNVTVGNNVSTIIQANIADLRSDVPAITDCNGLSVVGGTGFYICSSATLNMPAAATSGGSLIHIGRNNNPTQLFIDFNSNIMYLRSYKNAAWTVWESLGTNIQKDTWHTPAFVNSWVAHNDATFPVRYMIDSNGFVHLKGLIRGGAQGSIAFYLPVGYRSVASHQYAVDSNSTFGEVAIDQTGKIQVLLMSAGNWVSLDNIPPIPTF